MPLGARYHEIGSGFSWIFIISAEFNMFLEGHKIRKVDPPFTLMMLAPQHGEFDVDVNQ